jgi:hypothetical protein
VLLDSYLLPHTSYLIPHSLPSHLTRTPISLPPHTSACAGMKIMPISRCSMASFSRAVSIFSGMSAAQGALKCWCRDSCCA